MPVQKLESKIYRHHTHYPGGLVETRLEDLWRHDPTDVVRRAVSGMLPKNRNRKHFNRSLFIYRDGQHPHGDFASAGSAEAAKATALKLAEAHSATVVADSSPDGVGQSIARILAGAGAVVHAVPADARRIQ